MRRLLPSSLFGRLVLTFVSGLIITMVVTLLAQMPEREAFVFRISAGRGAQRVTDLVKLMDQLTPAGRERLAEIARTHRVPTVDPFGYPIAGRPWIAYSWLAELAFWWVTTSIGTHGAALTRISLRPGGRCGR